MDETSPAITPSAEHAPPVEGARVERRRRVREILSTQSSRLDRLEGELTERLQQVADEIAGELSTAGGEQAAAVAEAAHDARIATLSEQVERLRQELTAREDAVARANEQSEQARVDAARLEQELRVRDGLLAEAQSRDERNRVELTTAIEQLNDAKAQLTAARQRQEELRLEAIERNEHFAAEQEQDKAQRRRVAREFKARHAAQATQLEEQQAELARLRESLAQAVAEQDRLAVQIRDTAEPLGADSAELQELRRERDSLAQRLAAAGETHAEMERLAAALEKARIEAAGFEQELRVRETLLAETHGREERNRAELAATVEQLADTQARLTAASERLAAAEDAAQQLEQARVEAARLEQELHRRDARSADAQAREERNRAELAAAVEQLNDVQAQLTAARERQEELRRELAVQTELVADHEQKLTSQRRRIARQYRAKHAAQLAELEQRQAEVLGLRESLEQAQAEQQRLAAELRDATLAWGPESGEWNKLRDERDGLAERLAAAERRAAEADRAVVELEQARIEVGRLERELGTRDTKLAEAQTHDVRHRGELTAARTQLADAQAQLAAAQAQLAAAAERSAEAERTAVQLEQARIEAGKLAQELRVREALLTEAQGDQEKRRVELAAALEQLNDVQAQLTLARQRQDEIRSEAAAQSAGSSEHESELARLRAALEQAQAENKHLAGQLREAPAGGDSQELAALRKERDSLAKKLSAAEAKLSHAAASEPDRRGKDELQRRFEMAVEELRELKRTHAELEAKMAKTRGEGRPAAIGLGGGMDWEAQKQRMLATLEEDDRDEEDAIAERQSIQGTIEITDQIVGQKDREIAELKRRMEELTGGAAAGASAVAELLDHDEVIRQERDKLIQVQAEWREKIGKAEIDVSVERAKLARDRMELEDKLRAYQREQDNRPTESGGGGGAATPEKPARGRWLARLGLKDLNDES